MHWKDYDFTVINDNLEKCYKSIIKYIREKNKNKNSLNYSKDYIQKHIRKLVN